MTGDSKKLFSQLKQARANLKPRPQPKTPGASITPTPASIESLFEKASSGAMPAPASVLFVRSDSYGDLILFGPALAELKTQWPETRIGVMLKKRHEDIIPLLPSGIHYLTTDADPYRQTVAEYLNTVAFGDAVRDFAPEVLVAPSYEKSWMHALAALAAPNARRLSLGPVSFDKTVGTYLAEHGNQAADTLYPEVIPIDRDSHELEKSRRLLEQLVKRKFHAFLPACQLPKSAEAEARKILAELKLKPRKYIVCNPAGNANVSLKSWSPENYARVVDWLAEQHSVPVLLCAHVSEEPIVQSVLSFLKGKQHPAVWLGTSGQISVLAGLLAEAKFYFGNDTGTAHLAEAMQTPVLVVYGGGTWPRFKPVLSQSIALVHPLPCFGCGWDCHLVDAPCVKLVRPADVIAQLPRLLSAGPDDKERIVTVQRLPEEQLVSIKRSQNLWREIQADRVVRLGQILTLTHEIRFRDASIAELNRQTTEAQRRSHLAAAEVPTLRADMDQLGDKLRATELDSANRLQQIKILTAAVHAARDETAALQKQIESLSSIHLTEKNLSAEKGAQLAQLLANAQAANDESAQKCADLGRENTTLREAASAHVAKIHQLEEQIRALKIEVSRQTEKAGALLPLIDSLQKDGAEATVQFKAQLQRKDEELHTQRIQQESIEAELGRINKEHSALTANVSALADALREANVSREAETKKLTTERDTLRQTLAAEALSSAEELKKLVAERDRLEKTRAEERAAGAAEQAKLSRERDLLQQTLRSERESAAVSQQRNTDELAKASDTIVRLQRQKDYLDSMMADATRKIHREDEEIERLHVQLSKLTDQAEAQYVSSRESAHLILQTKAQLDEAAASAKRETSAREASQFHVTQLRMEVDQVRQDGETQLQLLSEQKDALLHRLRDEKDRALQQLRQDLEKSVHNRDKLQLEIEDQKSLLVEAAQNQAALARDGENKAAEVARLAAVLDSERTAQALFKEQSESSLAELQALLRSSHEAHEEQKSLVAALEDKLLKLEFAFGDLRLTYSDLETEHLTVKEALSRECVTLGAALQLKNQEFSDLQARLHGLEAAFTAYQQTSTHSIAALTTTLATAQEKLAQEKRIASAHRRSAMRLTERLTHARR